MRETAVAAVDRVRAHSGVARSAVGQLLRAERLEYTVAADESGALHGAGGRESPAVTAVHLVLDAGDGAVGHPVLGDGHGAGGGERLGAGVLHDAELLALVLAAVAVAESVDLLDGHVGVRGLAHPELLLAGVGASVMGGDGGHVAEVGGVAVVVLDVGVALLELGLVGLPGGVLDAGGQGRAGE